MKQIIYLALFFALSSPASAQALFVKRGKIEFERKTNVHRLYYSEEELSSFSETMKKLIPKFKVDYFDLLFNDNRSVYQPGREPETPNKGSLFFNAPGAANVVYKDLDAQISTSQKQIFETQFLVSDSLNKVEWKILPETRTIANFECRKAVGRICDSVVVVAFYTDEIVPSNGPESFGGLPGMILELAIPRLYTTWVATKLEVWEEADSRALRPPGKGKKAKQEDLISTINESIKNWGEKYRDRSLWFASL